MPVYRVQAWFDYVISAPSSQAAEQEALSGDVCTECYDANAEEINESEREALEIDNDERTPDQVYGDEYKARNTPGTPEYNERQEDAGQIRIEDLVHQFKTTRPV